MIYKNREIQLHKTLQSFVFSNQAIRWRALLLFFFLYTGNTIAQKSEFDLYIDSFNSTNAKNLLKQEYYLKEALKKVEKKEDFKLICGLTNNLGISFLRVNIGTKSQYWLEKSVEIGNQYNIEYPAALINLGHLYKNFGDNKKAIEYYTRSINYSKAINSCNGSGWGYYHLGINNTDKDSIEYYIDLAFQIWQNCPGREKGALGLYYKHQSQKANSLKDKIKLYHMGIAMDKRDYEEKISDPESGEIMMEKEIGKRFWMDLSRAYYRLKILDSAYYYATKAVEFYRSESNHSAIGSIKWLAELEEKDGNYKKALSLYKELHSLYIKENNPGHFNDFMKEQLKRQDEQEKRISQAKINLESQKRRQAEQESKSKHIQLLIALAGIIISVVFGVLAYLRYKLTRKQNIIIENQKEELVRNNIAIEKEKKEANRQRDEANKQRQRSDELLLNILPEEVAEELKAKGSADAKQFDEVTVLFTDFKNFTQISEKMSPTELVDELNNYFKAFDEIITQNNIEKIKTIGDSYMCVGGLPAASPSHAEDVVNAGLLIQHFVEEHSKARIAQGKEPLIIRIGIHSGPVVAGIVGVKKYAYDIWGDTVNTASRMESSGEAGKVNISEATYELVKDKFRCTPRGKIAAKHKGDMEMYFVDGRV